MVRPTIMTIWVHQQGVVVVVYLRQVWMSTLHFSSKVYMYVLKLIELCIISSTVLVFAGEQRFHT